LGQTWAPVPVPSQADLNSVAFISPNVALAVGAGGNILRSTDGGQSWTLVDSGTTETLNKVALAGVGTAIAVGWHGTILRSTDGGLSWQQQSENIDPANNFLDISFAGPVGIAVAANGHAFKTTDGGARWTPLEIPGSSTSLPFTCSAPLRLLWLEKKALF
jgi:photosystem II stability/assembly factor-like uncharacterized protein